MNNTDDKKLIVMVFGTFDYLHAGHENYINQARTLGNEVIAIVARDNTVKNIKGRYPDVNEKNRVKNLSETKWADKVMLGHPKDKMKAIKSIKPQIIALGYDQFAFTYNLEKLIIENNLNTKIVRLTPYKANIYKSTLLKQKAKHDKNNITQP